MILLWFHYATKVDFISDNSKFTGRFVLILTFILKRKPFLFVLLWAYL